MKLKIQLLNCLWLMIPLLIWNIILGLRIVNEKLLSDANSHQWLLIAENLTRIAVFGLPLLIPLQLKNPQKKIGLLIFTVGTLIYFGSWIPHLAAPQFAWSNSKLGLLTPRLTPLISLIGIAVIGNSWLYAGISVIFITLHTWHGIQNL